MASTLRGFTITLRHTTVGRTPLDEWSARRRDLTTQSTHNRQTSMPEAGFEPTIPARQRPQTYASDRAATGVSHEFTVKYTTRACVDHIRFLMNENTYSLKQGTVGSCNYEIQNNVPLRNAPTRGSPTWSRLGVHKSLAPGHCLD